MWATSDMDVIFCARSSWSHRSIGITARMSSPKSKSRLRVRDREIETLRLRERERERNLGAAGAARERGSNSSTVRREEEWRR